MANVELGLRTGLSDSRNKPLPHQINGSLHWLFIRLAWEACENKNKYKNKTPTFGSHLQTCEVRISRDGAQTAVFSSEWPCEIVMCSQSREPPCYITVRISNGLRMFPLLVTKRLLSRALLLDVLSTDPQQRQPQGTSNKFSISGLIPGQWNQNRSFNQIPICTLNMRPIRKCALDGAH